MTKIAFHIQSLLTGGIEKVLIQQLHFLDREKYDITLLVTYDMGDLEKLKNDIPKDIKIHYLVEGSWLSKTRRLKAQGQLRGPHKIYDEFLQIFRRQQIRQRLPLFLKAIDVLIDFDLTLGSFVKGLPCKKMGWMHFSLSHYHRGNSRKIRRFGRKFENYDKLIFIADSMLKQAKEIFPESSEKFALIYNAMDFVTLRQRGQDLSGLSEDTKQLLEKKYILSVGRLEETQKDFTTLIKAYSQIASRLAHDLVVVGDGRHAHQLRDLTVRLNIQDRVHFTGFQSNPYVFMSHCDVFVLSSRFEGLPTVLIEAMSFGKTLVSTDCPTGPFEILGGGKFGYLVPVGNSDKMAEALMSSGEGKVLASQGQLNEQLQLFDKDHIAEVLDRYYRV